MEYIGSIIYSFLYELLPIRPLDAVRLLRWSHENLIELVVAMGSMSRSTLDILGNLPSTTYFVGFCWIGMLFLVNHFFPEFDRMFVALSVLALMLLGIGFDRKKRGDFSAYSVFNGFNRLIGAAEENLEQEMGINLRRRGGG